VAVLPTESSAKFRAEAGGAPDQQVPQNASCERAKAEAVGRGCRPVGYGGVELPSRWAPLEGSVMQWEHFRDQDRACPIQPRGCRNNGQALSERSPRRENTCLATQLRLLRPLRLSRACSQHLIQVVFRRDTPATPLKQGAPLQRQGHMMEITFDLRFGL
jgi:hypothetical protein